MKSCHWDGMETDQENLQDLSTKNISFDHKNECWTMKLEWVLTMKIVDNFVCFGMPYPGYMDWEHRKVLYMYLVWEIRANVDIC